MVVSSSVSVSVSMLMLVLVSVLALVSALVKKRENDLRMYSKLVSPTTTLNFETPGHSKHPHVPQNTMSLSINTSVDAIIYRLQPLPDKVPDQA